MASFIHLNSALAQNLAVTLLHFLWQGVVVGVLVFLLTRLMKKSSAEIRYGINLVGLLLMAACPIGTLIWLIAESTQPGPDGNDVPIAVSLAGQDMIAAEISHASNQALPEDKFTIADNTSESFVPIDKTFTPNSLVEFPTEATVAPGKPEVGNDARSTQASTEWISRLMLSGYGFGVLLMLVRIMVGVGQTRSLRKNSCRVTEPEVLSVINNAINQLGIRFQPLILLCEKVSVPIVVGLVRPAVLLPASIASSLTIHELQTVLAHELAHVRRYDPWVNLFQRFIEAFLFFHPAVWHLSRRVSIEREICCDELALRETSESHGRIAYAGLLVRLAEASQLSGKLTPTSAIPLAEKNPSQLRERIERLLGEPSRSRFRFSTRNLTAACLLFAALFAGMTAIAGPKISTAKLKGIVFDKNTKPIPKAEVRIEYAKNRTGNAKIVRTATCDDDGRFSLNDLQPGRVRITASIADPNMKNQRLESSEVSTQLKANHNSEVAIIIDLAFEDTISSKETNEGVTTNSTELSGLKTCEYLNSVHEKTSFITKQQKCSSCHNGILGDHSQLLKSGNQRCTSCHVYNPNLNKVFSSSYKVPSESNKKEWWQKEPYIHHPWFHIWFHDTRGLNANDGQALFPTRIGYDPNHWVDGLWPDRYGKVKTKLLPAGKVTMMCNDWPTCTLVDLHVEENNAYDHATVPAVKGVNEGGSNPKLTVSGSFTNSENGPMITVIAKNESNRNYELRRADLSIANNKFRCLPPIKNKTEIVIKPGESRTFEMNWKDCIQKGRWVYDFMMLIPLPSIRVGVNAKIIQWEQDRTWNLYFGGNRVHFHNLPEPEEIQQAELKKLKPFVVHGIVTRQGMPMKNIIIRVHSGSGTLKRVGEVKTDENGRYECRFGPGMRMKIGEKTPHGVGFQAATITATCPDTYYESWSEKNLNRQGDCYIADGDVDFKKMKWLKPNQVISLNQPKEVNFEMIRDHFYEVVVMDSNGNRLKNKKISLNGKELPPSSGVLEQQTTDENGKIVFKNVPANFKWWLEHSTPHNPPHSRSKTYKTKELILKDEMSRTIDGKKTFYFRVFLNETANKPEERLKAKLVEHTTLLRDFHGMNKVDVVQGQQPPKNDKRGLVWGKAADGFQAAFFIENKKETYHLNDVLDMKIILRNVSKETRWFEFPSSLDAFIDPKHSPYTIVDKDGEPVRQSSIWYTGRPRHKRCYLKPGQEVTLEAGDLALLPDIKGAKRPEKRYPTYLFYLKPGKFTLKHRGVYFLGSSGMYEFPPIDKSIKPYSIFGTPLILGEIKVQVAEKAQVSKIGIDTAATLRIPRDTPVKVVVGQIDALKQAGVTKIRLSATDALVKITEEKEPKKVTAIASPTQIAQQWMNLVKQDKIKESWELTAPDRKGVYGHGTLQKLWAKDEIYARHWLGNDTAAMVLTNRIRDNSGRSRVLRFYLAKIDGKWLLDQSEFYPPEDVEKQLYGFLAHPGVKFHVEKAHLVGTWSSQFFVAGSIETTFNKDGSMKIVENLRDGTTVKTGTWSLNGNRIGITLDVKTQLGTIVFNSEDRISISYGKGGTMGYDRIPDPKSGDQKLTKYLVGTWTESADKNARHGFMKHQNYEMSTKIDDQPVLRAGSWKIENDRLILNTADVQTRVKIKIIDDDHFQQEFRNRGGKIIFTRVKEVAKATGGLEVFDRALGYDLIENRSKDSGVQK